MFSVKPTTEPSVRTSEPLSPTSQPSQSPSLTPTVLPSGSPSGIPSFIPKTTPSSAPSAGPSSRPSCPPSEHPSPASSLNPTAGPSTARPSTFPTTEVSLLFPDDSAVACMSECSFPGNVNDPSVWSKSEFCEFYEFTGCSLDNVSSYTCAPQCLSDCVNVFCDIFPKLASICGISSLSDDEVASAELLCLTSFSEKTGTLTQLVFETTLIFQGVTADEFLLDVSAQNATKFVIASFMNNINVLQIRIVSIVSNTRPEAQNSTNRRLNEGEDAIVTYEIDVFIEPLGFQQGQLAYKSMVTSLTSAYIVGEIRRKLNEDGEPQYGTRLFNNDFDITDATFSEPVVQYVKTVSPTKIPTQIPTIEPTIKAKDDASFPLSTMVSIVVPIVFLLCCGSGFLMYYLKKSTIKKKYLASQVAVGGNQTDEDLDQTAHIVTVHKPENNAVVTPVEELKEDPPPIRIIALSEFSLQSSAPLAGLVGSRKIKLPPISGGGDAITVSLNDIKRAKKRRSKKKNNFSDVSEASTEASRNFVEPVYSAPRQTLLTHSGTRPGPGRGIHSISQPGRGGPGNNVYRIPENPLYLESSQRRGELEERRITSPPMNITDSDSLKLSRVPPGGNYANKHIGTQQLKHSSKRKYAKQRYEADHHYDNAVVAFEEDPEKMHHSVLSGAQHSQLGGSKYASSGRTVLPSLGSVIGGFKELPEERSIISVSGTRRKRRTPVRFAGPGEANDSDDAHARTVQNGEVPSPEHASSSTFGHLRDRRPPGAGSY